MRLQGRNLESGMRGDDVKLLQDELRQLGFQISENSEEFDSDTFIAVENFQQRQNLPRTGIVDPRTARSINKAVDQLNREEYIVRGQLLRPDGEPLPGQRVFLRGKRIRSEFRLGAASTDEEGRYEIRYPAQGSERLCILVRALDVQGNEAAVSRVICAVKPVETVNLVVGDKPFRGLSEYRKIRKSILQELEAEEIDPAELDEEEVNVLASRLDLNPEHAALFVASTRLQAESDITAEALYGLLRDGLSPQLEALVAQDPESLRGSLEKSIDQNIIRERFRDRIPGIIEALREQIVKIALKDPEPDRGTFKAYFDIARVSSRHQTSILSSYLNREGSVNEFWQSLRSNPDVADREIDSLQHTLKVGTMALNHLPLVEEVMRRRRSGQVGRELRDLAHLSQDDWESLLLTEVDGKAIGAPLFFGDNEDERLARYSRFLPRMVETVFPTAVLARVMRTVDADAFDFSPAIEFFERHPDFEFNEGSINTYLELNPEAFEGIRDREATLDQLKTVQRLFAIAPAFDKSKVVMALMASKQESAVKIRRLGLGHFIRTNAEALGGEVLARQVYDRASRRADTALYVLSQSALFSPIALPHLKLQLLENQLETQGLPDLRDLFGRMDLCACEHCASVYSPAAYLVDVLHFLMNRRANDAATTALDLLFERRPDIGEIELNCHNTQTEMPYVDLVNEILEQAVVSGGSLPPAAVEADPDDTVFPFQTRVEAAQLEAEPEHLNQDAYDRLALEAVYPWHLPFDLWAEETRLYLEQLGVERHLLMNLLHVPEGGAPSIDIAAEYLGLTPKEVAILTGTDPASLNTMWGLENLNTLTGENNAGVILRQSQLSFAELKTLLETPFIHDGRDMSIRFEGADCNIASADIPNVDTASLSRMHRFVRLQRKLGWPIETLGNVLSRLGIDDLDAQALINIAQLKKLERELEAPLDRMLSWWSPRLDTSLRSDGTSFYARTFLNPTVTRPAVDAEIFELNADRSELRMASPPNTPESLAPHAVALQTILGIDAEAFRAIVDSELANDTLDLGNLTRLFQVTTMAKAMKLTIAEFLSLKALTGINPFESGNVQAAVALWEQRKAVRESGFDIAVVDYLLRHQMDAAPGIVTPVDIGLFLKRLATQMETIQAQNHFQPGLDPSGTRTIEKLSLLYSPDIVGQIVTMIQADSGGETPFDREALVNAHLAPFLAVEDAIENLIDPGTLTSVSDRFDYVLEPLLAHIVGLMQEDLIITSLAEMLGFSTAVTDKLVRELLTDPNNPDEPIINAFLGAELLAVFEANPDDDFIPSEEVLPSPFAAMQRLLKIAMIFNTIGTQIDTDQVTTIMTRGPDMGWLDVAALPLTTESEDSGLFRRWRETIDLFRVLLSLPKDLSTALGLITTLDDPDADRTRFLNEVAALTGWSFTDLDFLTGSEAYGLQFPGDFRSLQFLSRLKPIFNLIQALGVSAATAWRWRAPVVDKPLARTVRQALRSKYTDEPQWFRAAKPITDKLREQQRTALVAFLIERLPHVEDANDLYSHFLIDVEMDPCMLTSRLVQATSAVQLFIQRCLLNLERVALTPEDAQEWAWMKNYRVWEANRKVFLYPENWIAPELRDDKTPFFLPLESTLQQSEVNQDTIEIAYRQYLQALNEVAQLEIMGLYVEADIKNYVLHVFGRTKNTPHTYYYRRWMNKRYWTPWEKVNVDIEGNHLIPVVWNRRLYLFWPLFVEKAVADTDTEGDQPPPKHYYEIRMVWSEYRDKAWLPKKVTSTHSDTTLGVNQERKRDFIFWTDFDSAGNLMVCYSGYFSIGQFRFSANGSVDRLKYRKYNQTWVPFAPVRHFWPVYGFIPGTGPLSNRMKEIPSHNALDLPANIETASFKFDFSQGPLDIEVLTDSSSIQVFGNTPGLFKLAPVHTEKYFRSFNPFFYNDARRCFFVVPRGTYSGGFDGGIDQDLTIEMRPIDAIPLDLPDAVRTASLTAIQGSHVHRTASGARPGNAQAGNLLIADRRGDAPEIGPTREIGTIINPPASLYQAFFPKQWTATAFQFDAHYHPFVPLLIEQLNKYGIDGILQPEDKMEPKKPKLIGRLHRQKLMRMYFMAEYQPNQSVVDNVRDLTPAQLLFDLRPRDEFDFSYAGAYSAYNWELFFHVPFMLAKRLSANQRFAEALRWYHYIFNPTYSPPTADDEPWPERVWQIKPFFEEGVGRTIQATMMLLKSSGLNRQQRLARQELRYQIDAWRKNPFNPHLLARMRPVAYMKAVVMAYLDNLIAWGDNLFRQDTRESINEATQLYILAAEILGKRPREVAAHEDARPTIDGEEVRTFNDIRGRLDDFSNVLVELETQIDDSDLDTGAGVNPILGASGFKIRSAGGSSPGFAPDLPIAVVGDDDDEPEDDDPTGEDATPLPAILGPTLFFCIPKNDKLLDYWDVVADRLFKIRHCLNIEGVERQLALFQPPIDPGLLVKAAASGVDIGGVLSNLNAPPPNHRFQVLARKAGEFIGDLRNLGAAMLAALEKKDAEEMALLRSTHEISLAKSMLKIKKAQLREAQKRSEVLLAAREVAVDRRRHFSVLQHQDEEKGTLNDSEFRYIEQLKIARDDEVEAQDAQEMAANLTRFLPDVVVGWTSLGPNVTASLGRSNITNFHQFKVQKKTNESSTHAYNANMSNIFGAWRRRYQEWTLQREQADLEVKKIDQEMATAALSAEVIEKDIKNQKKHIERQVEIDRFLQDKYTHRELYSWMLSQISSVFFQSYQLAYDLAQQAERAFHYELGTADTHYIQFGHWDSLKKGLLAGEKLHHDLKRMESAYLEENRRELELTKHVSLAMLDPMALLNLKEEGRCEIEIPEALFDLDYPGHYFRRIKSMRITIPAVTGPYTTLACTLRLLRSTIRRQGTLAGGVYARDPENEDARFSDRFGAIQSIATSSGQNDAGLFELNFRDERYLPFEGTGVISRWQLEMPDRFRQFDYDAISDVILHISYTARDGGNLLRQAAEDHLEEAFNGMVTGEGAPGLMQSISTRHDFPTVFHRFLHPEDDAEAPTMTLNIGSDRFPYMFKGRDIQVGRIHAFLRLNDPLEDISVDGTALALSHPEGDIDVNFDAAVAIGNIRHVDSGPLASGPGEWRITLSSVGDGLADENNRLNPELVEDLILILHYTVA